MWQLEFKAVQSFIADLGLDTSLPAIEVGGGPVIVIDNQPQRNPMLDFIPVLTFLDEGFIRRYGATPHIQADFTDWGQIKHLAGKYDLVFSYQTLEHVTNPWRFVRHLVAVTRPGGMIFLTTVFRFPYHPSPHDYWRFSPDGLVVLFHEAGDNLMLWSGFGPPDGCVMAVVQRKPASHTPYPVRLLFSELELT